MAVDLDKYKKATSSGSTPDLSKYKKGGAPQPEQKPSLMSRFVQGAEDFGKGAFYGATSIGRNIQNTLSKGVDAVTGTEGFGANTQKPIESTAFKTGEVVGEIAPYLMPGAGSAKGLGFLGKTGANIAQNSAIATAQTGDLGEGVKTGLIGEAISMASRPLGSVAQGVYKLGVPLAKREAGMVQGYKAATPLVNRVGNTIAGKSEAPITAADTAFRKGLKGTESMIGVQARKEAKNVWKKTIEPALKEIKDEVKLPEFFDDVEKTIVKNTPELSDRKDLITALKSIREDYAGKKGVSFEELQKLKEGWAKRVPEKVYEGKPIAGAFNNVRNVLATTAREKIHKKIGSKEVKQAYIDYGNMKGLQDWGQKAMTGGKLRGGTGGFISAAKDMIVTPIATVGGRVVYRTANGIERLGAAGAHTLGDLLGDNEQ